MYTTLRILLLLVISFTGLHAQIITDRPDQTEASSTVAEGALQIESGFYLEHRGEFPENEKSIAAPNTLFRYGLSKGFELRLFSQYESFSDRTFTNFSGMSDLQIGFKAQLYQKEESPSEVAFLGHLIVPSGNSLFTIDNYGFLSRILVSHYISENSSLGYNIGYEYFGSGSGNAIYTLSFSHSVSDKLSLFVEPFGELTELETFVMNFNSGIAYLVYDNLQLDFSFGTGITDRMNFMSFGISWLIERNKN